MAQTRTLAMNPAQHRKFHEKAAYSAWKKASQLRKQAGYDPETEEYRSAELFDRLGTLNHFASKEQLLMEDCPVCCQYVGKKGSAS